MHANFQDPIPACAGMTKKEEITQKNWGRTPNLFS
jgi:hypothetical protein